MTSWDPGAFRGKAVMVTGAAAGIGEATARRFAEHGADVVLVDLDLERAESVAAKLQALGKRSFAVRADASRSADVQAAVDACLARLGKVDVLVNNAGGYPAKVLVVNTTEEDWDRIVDVNLKSVFLFSKAVLPTMIAQRSGRIVNVSSEAGHSVQHLTAAHYAAAKAGMRGFTQHLAKEVGGYNITVNAIAPGVTTSPRNDKIYDAAKYREFGTQIPLGRVATPEDQADAILFLASDAASYITGVTLDVNGGRMMV